MMARKSLQDSIDEARLARATNSTRMNSMPFIGPLYNLGEDIGYVTTDQLYPRAVSVGNYVGNYVNNASDELENLLAKAKDTTAGIGRTFYDGLADVGRTAVDIAGKTPAGKVARTIAGERYDDDDMLSGLAINKRYNGEGNPNWSAYTVSDEDSLVKQREEPSLGSILDKYIEDYKNLPKTEYGVYPERGTTDIPDLEDKMDYNSNFQLNPYKSVKDWRDDSGIAYMAEINPYWAAGMGLANQVANPYKQRYFEGRADENLVEEARRAQEELRYNRDLEKEKTRRDLEKANYDMRKAALDTAYLDDVNKLKYNNSVSANKRKEEQDLLNIIKDADVLKRDDAVNFNSLAGYKNSKIVNKPFTEEVMWSWSPADKEKFNELLKARNREISSSPNQNQVDAIFEKYNGDNGLLKQMSNNARKSLLPYEAAKVFLDNGQKISYRDLYDDVSGSVSSTGLLLLDKMLGTEFGADANLDEDTKDSLESIKSDIGYNGSLIALPNNPYVLNKFYGALPAGYVNRFINNNLTPHNIVATVNRDGRIVNTYIVQNGKLLHKDGTDIDDLNYRAKKSTISDTKKAQEQS